MNNAAHIRDEDLTAYLDGEAGAELSHRIEQALEHDLSLKDRLSALTLDISSLRREFLTTHPEPPELPALPPLRKERGIARVFVTGLAAGLGISALLFAADFIRPQPAEGWASFVASYQMLYTPETLNTADPTADDRASQLQRVSSAVDLDLSDLPDVSGLKFKRAQVLGFRGKPLIQIAYQSPDGTPVALCIILSDRSAPLDMTEGEAEGLHTVRWDRANHQFLLIGDVEAQHLLQAAEVFAASL